MKKILPIFIILIFACQAIFAFSNKHTYHTSFTRIDYNLQEKLLEISVKVFAHDLLPTLEKRTGKSVNLENTKDIDEILQKYLAEKFVLKTKSGEVKNLKWVGKELEPEVILFYLEIPFDEELEGAELQNSLFFENFKQQINLVSIHNVDAKADLVFKVGDGFKVIKNNAQKQKVSR